MGRSSRELHKVIVVGLPTTSTTEDLLKLVKPYGNALEAAHAVDAEGKPRGFAFVRFADADAQQAAIAGLDKSDLGGRTLNVRAVEDRSAGAASAAAKGRPCFDFARGKCSRGAACKWAHVKPPAAAMRATLTAALERKEAAWREAHPEAEGEPVPAEALRRDVAWSAMRRMLERCPREVVGE
ncbi:hypothetical protein EMIHUDRAFT_199849 [Emiliania huxleyi CCMP1516]|uniref:RRM domain-containing protein n=2 Tax=Emiliania huxleyi TaxID=2903 RepID=A0A0D3KUH8_EMIH1|nr:hypothetical protein EMIHUDRAFT_246960 [Emiliania huxleyi CCMP1516]XP_005791842.1 hypothetical protein EMIHUDRAFT_199849 [Emiliania huxleyi CCMP1516]EOD13336.1 hypothetical protein EMIHUDRAFT_246960 [Emiliania huxleyi CCMP1516]EOD39413.1 hypothetical protein EMIHUDRAFT_199849 [Emiliania huxleyi CCMP1516]|eukprot:XP_005765765.1 hypothetical protein EMIHUDRAFT_246960 [Emiliania huxleyi CCMP1516]